MINAQTFLGEPSWFQNICQIYPPTVRQVLVTPEFSVYESILTLAAEDIEDKLREAGETENFPTPLEFLLNNCFNHKDYSQLAKEAFSFFIHEEVEFLYDTKMIWIGGIGDLSEITDISQVKLLTEANFLDFQNALRRALGAKEREAPNPDEDPRVKRIKAKGRQRDRLKAKKGGGISLTTSLAAICCMGIGITPLTIGELSYASVSTLIDMYQNKEKYETDLRSIQAGADPKKVKPKYWIRNLE